MTASAEDCAIYQPAPSGFAGEQLSSLPYLSTDVSMYVLSYGAAPKWWYGAKSMLEELGKLPAGWDSYGAKPIAPSARSAALDVLRQISTRRTPQPAIVPTSDGSIQLEWHTHDIDLEVRVLSPTKIGVCLEDARNQIDEIDEELQYDFTRLVHAIDVLSNR
ncbi:MAG TPA: hypothetical protein VJT10_21075 [Steroidobacteraceae bacterium]|nr:hypothetical protein [Steroidobacteraceae bacterium]